jgi:hypothetical protein
MAMDEADMEFENIIDELLENDFEYLDIVRVTTQGDGSVDKSDAEKLIADFCSLRYRHTFIYFAMSAIGLISRPKKDHKTSVRHLKKAIHILEVMLSNMERVHERIQAKKEGEEGEGKEGEEAEEK